MPTILVAMRIWGPLWMGKNIKIHCDNEGVVSILITCKTKDVLLPAIARNIFMETAKFDICLRTVPISGKNIADSLSNFFLSDKHIQRFISYYQAPANALEVNWII